MTALLPAPVSQAPSAAAIDAEAVLKRLDWHVVRRLDGLLQGDYRSLFTGQGYDLAEVREYQPEDDIRYMDWNVTARMDHPYVRQYVEDREITAWLLLDVSPSVDFGTANVRKRDLVVDFAGVISRLLTRHGNKVGAMLFSSAVDEIVQPRGGQLQPLRLVHQLVRPDRHSAAGATDLAAILDRAAQTLRRRSLVFVVSDFIAAEGWEMPLARLAQRHELLAVWLHDPREGDIPSIGPLFFEDSETGDQVYVDTNDKGFQRRFHALVEERTNKLERIFSRHGIDVLQLSTDGDLAQSIARFALLRKEARRRPGARAAGAMA
ncbi:MAG TPA: DUF58 domain-containing protein [Dehalococcoidia bacterium]|nr:DUF58 domain-containing protein [Dehalococcoidia bacterium]